MSPDIGEASENVEDTDAAAALSIGFNSTLRPAALAIRAAALRCRRSGARSRPTPSTTAPRGRRPAHVEQGLKGRGTDERQRIVAIHAADRPVQQCAADADGVEARAEPGEITDLEPRARERRTSSPGVMNMSQSCVPGATRPSHS